MASTEKTKKTSSVSQKQSIKERRELQRQRQQRQQQILLAVVAVVLLVGVIAVVFLSTRPVEAYIPPDALTRYKTLADKKLVGTTPEGFPYLGADNAPTKMEEIASLACIVCKNYHDSVVVSILDEIEAGRLKFVFIPVTTTGEFVPRPATEAALCANDQGKFWEMQEILFDWQTRYGGSTNDTKRLSQAAQAIGLDMDKFNSCLNSQAPKDVIGRGEDFAVKHQMTGTPTIYLDGQEIQPNPVSGRSPSLGELRGIIEAKAAPQK